MKNSVGRKKVIFQLLPFSSAPFDSVKLQYAVVVYVGVW